MLLQKTQEPIGSDDALEIATAVLPPYLCNAEDAAITVNQYKRYRMQDIAKLEERIKKQSFTLHYLFLRLILKICLSVMLTD